MAKNQLSVTLTKSLIGEKPKTRANVRSLGLSRLHQTVDLADTPQVRGVLQRIAHLVEVEED